MSTAADTARTLVYPLRETHLLVYAPDLERSVSLFEAQRRRPGELANIDHVGSWLSTLA